MSTVGRARSSGQQAVELVARTLDATPTWRWCCRHWALLLAVGCAVTVARDAFGSPNDTVLFDLAGRKLWSADALDAFADPIIQAGVAQLTLYAATGGVERALSLPRFQFTSAVLQYSITFGVVGLTAVPFRRRGLSAPPSLLLAIGAVVLLLGLGSELYGAGHPAQFAVTACWVLAGVAALQRRPAVSGLALAAATAWEPWGLLGAPLLVLLPGPRLWARGAAWCAAALAVLWAPFVLLGDFAMHHYRWEVRLHSPLAAVLGTGAPFGWELRVLQGGLALAAGLAMAYLTRRSPHRVWSVPLVVSVVRLAVDPVAADYYWASVKVLAIVAAAFFLAERDARGWRVLPFLYPAFLTTGVPHWVMVTSVLIGMGMLAAAGRGADISEDPAPGVTRPGGSEQEPPGRSSPRPRVPTV